jgi:hypothetical protein
MASHMVSIFFLVCLFLFTPSVVLAEVREMDPVSPSGWDSSVLKITSLNIRVHLHNHMCLLNPMSRQR